jgi:hypothetical protein
VPTTGTSVFDAQTWAGSGSASTQVRLASSSPVSAADLFFVSSTGVFNRNALFDRLRNQNNSPAYSSRNLVTYSTSAEGNSPANDANGTFSMDYMNGFAGQQDYWAYTGRNYVGWFFKRAPGTFDEVCYSGNSSTQTVTHNLGAVPELMIVKIRNGVSGWPVYSSAVGNTKFVRLNTTSAESVDNLWANTTPTASSFTVGNNGDANQSGGNYVAYLWATNPGVTKVGTYTGNGSSQTINCGFTSGARFVMIKAVSTTGNWIVADSARGIVAGNDPALYLNSTAAEVTGFDWIDADSTGFVVNETATIAANTNGVQYIYLSYA